jgi:antitoxin MazE
MMSHVSKWGNSQGIRISKKILQAAQIKINDEVEVKVKDNMLIIVPTTKKTLAWYLEGYDNAEDRYDWGNTDEQLGRELL